MIPLPIHGRGATGDPPNRFERLAYEPDPAERDPDAPAPQTQFFRDHTKGIFSRNDSPDVPFDVSINPYRGCEHGCVYCFARPTHEYLGFSLGLDFESRILVKERAAELLRGELMSPRWRPVAIAMSGVTDPYQPIERRLRITRGCLEVLAEFRNPVAMITKNRLIVRDLDLLSGMAEWGGAVVYLSVTTLDRELQRVMEPRAATPERRLDAIRALTQAGVPTGVMVAPCIPGLTDQEMPAILAAAAEAGARTAGFVPLRLPHGLTGLFEDWLEAHYPDRKSKVLGRIREMRGGKLNDPRFGSRMRGEGAYAAQLRDLFAVTTRRLGLNARSTTLRIDKFRRPGAGGQLSLIE